MQNSDEQLSDKKLEKRLIKTVEKNGWQVNQIESDGYTPSFAYTIGLTKSYGHPELIILGLDVNLMGELLNIAGDLVKNGKVLKLDTLYDDFLQDYNCKFINVHKDYFKDYLGYCTWFNKGNDFDTYQLVWPNKNGCFPFESVENNDFNFRQPLLDRNMNFKFLEAENLATFTTRPVIDNELPILYVYHDEEGDWQFLCGSTNDSEDMRMVSLKYIVEIDNSVNELHNLGLGEYAWRESISDKWNRDKIEK